VVSKASGNDMASDTVVRTIDTLLAVEGGSLLLRLEHAGAYVPHSESDLANALQEMVDEEKEHRRKLVDLLDEFGATPGPRRVHSYPADVHYNQLHVLLPRFIADKKRLIGEYEAGAALVVSEPKATDLVASILASHRRHLARLEELRKTVTA
jgi:hypothetical protein